jgi:hypothetical protein
MVSSALKQTALKASVSHEKNSIQFTKRINYRKTGGEKGYGRVWDPQFKRTNCLFILFIGYACYAIPWYEDFELWWY